MTKYRLAVYNYLLDKTNQYVPDMENSGKGGIMMTMIMDNMGTILVSAGLIVMVSLILRSMWKKKKSGISSCGCGCSSCPSSGICHKQ